MIQSKFGHIQFNVRAQNMAFYKDLFTYLGWRTLVDEPMMLGVGSDAHYSLWFSSGEKEVSNDYDGPGMNHLALDVQRQDEVDQMVAYLHQRGISPLFDTPRHRPEFSQDAEHTYYQVMFESPDRILLEVVYIGKLDPKRSPG